MARFSILTALGVALLAALAFAIDDGTRCSNRNQAVVNAIGKFCQNKNMRIPSTYTNNGMWSNDKRASISITGICFPSQYVPQDVCFSQFYNLCATGGPKGGNSRWYGWKGNKCQNWQIHA